MGELNSSCIVFPVIKSILPTPARCAILIIQSALALNSQRRLVLDILELFLMLSFEKLVHETTRALVSDHPDMTPSAVREVLQDAGVDEALRDAVPAPQGRLIVHHVQITGDKLRAEGLPQPFSYQRKLGSGLWAWVGHNGSGKSTLLNCILWALTGSDSGIPKRLKPWIRDVAVQFTVGDQPFTSRVSRDGEAIRGGIFRGLLAFNELDLGIVDAVARFENRDEMREMIDRFFMQYLGITTLRWTAHSAEKDDPDLHAHSTTWRTYAHAIHIDDDSYDYLIIDPQKGYGRQDRKILEMMLGVEQSRIVSEIQVQADFAKEAYGRARSRMGNRRSNTHDQIMALEAELAEVQSAIDAIQNDMLPVEDDSALVAVREKRASLLNEQNVLSQQVSSMEGQRSAVERDMLEAEREKVALQEQGEVAYLINSLVVVRCPHCESMVNREERLEREKHDHTCHVCDQPIQRTRTNGDLKSILREHDQQINVLRSTFQRIQKDTADTLQRLSASRDEAIQLAKQLEQGVQQAREGFSVSYTSLLVRKGQLDGQLEQLRRGVSEIEAEQNEVDMAAHWHLILQTAADIADQTVFESNETIFSRLGELAVTLATQFGVPDLERVVIDEKRYVRLIQGGMSILHSDLARSERVKFKVAFHLALMLLQSRDGLGRHPCFLIIDTPGTAEVNEADFAAMTKDLARVHATYGDQVQILMATARSEALHYLPGGVSETADDSETFF